MLPFFPSKQYYGKILIIPQKHCLDSRWNILIYNHWFPGTSFLPVISSELVEPLFNYFPRYFPEVAEKCKHWNWSAGYSNRDQTSVNISSWFVLFILVFWTKWLVTTMLWCVCSFVKSYDNAVVINFVFGSRTGNTPGYWIGFEGSIPFSRFLPEG